MTRREYTNYERDFDALTGEAAPRSVRFLTGAASVPALKSTGAPRHVLRHAWVLADADRDGNLTFDEFVVAMYLCERAAEGCELPQTLDAYAPGEFPPREFAPSPSTSSGDAPNDRVVFVADTNRRDDVQEAVESSSEAVPVPATVRSRIVTPVAKPGKPGEGAYRAMTPTTKPPAPPERKSYPSATKQVPFKLTPPGSTTKPRGARTAAEAAAEAEEERRRRRTDREPDVDRLNALHDDANARRFHRDAAAALSAAERTAEEDAACTFEPAINAYSRGIVRSPAQTLEARATAIVVGRETRRRMARDLARLEAEESSLGVGTTTVAGVDPDALAAKIARWEHERVEREFRLERARDAKASEETNGGFRPALSSTRRSVSLRERVVAADGRPWHERLGDDDAYASARKAKDASRALVAEAMESAAMDAPRTATRTEEERRRAARAMHAEAATRAARRDADRRDEAREMARRAPKLAAGDVERLVRKARVAAVRAIERRAVRDGSYLERDALGPALRDAGVFANAPPTTRGAIRDEARAVYRLCACLGEGEGDDLAVPAWLFARFAGAVSRAETDRVRDRERDDERREPETDDANVVAKSFRRSAGGSDLGREFDVGRWARGSRTPWWPAGYSAEREASLAETFASVAGTAAANAKLSRTPIGRDRSRRRDRDDEPDRDDASARTVSAPASPAARLSFDEPSSAPGSVYRPPPSPATSASASASARRSAARLGYPGESVADRLARKRAETERAIAERRAAKEAEESAECTFRPKITRGYRPSSANAIANATSSTTASTSARAYVSASEKYPTREQREAMELAECTFKPKINKPPRYLVDKPPGEPLKAWERRAPSAEEAARREEARRRAREASNNPTERWSGPPPWEPRKGKIRRPPPPPPPPRTARPRSAAPPGYEETVRRMRAAKEARETLGEASVLDSRAAWIDPRGAADAKKKKAEAKAAKTGARLAKAATQNLPAAWRASSSARKIRTSRDGTGGIPPSPTTEKDTAEPGGDGADDDDVFARATESNAPASAPSPSPSSRHGSYDSLGSPPNRSASPSRASPRRPPPLEVELSFGSSADFGARSVARSRRDFDSDSPKGLPSTPPSANRRASSTSTPTRMASSPGSPVLSASATLDLRKNAPSLTPLPRSPRSGTATPSSPVSPDGLPYAKFVPGPVILAVELAIGETRDAKTRTLEFREGDRVPDAARRFCDAHRLPNSVAADVEVVLEESLRVYFAEAAR